MPEAPDHSYPRGDSSDDPAVLRTSGRRRGRDRAVLLEARRPALLLCALSVGVAGIAGLGTAAVHAVRSTANLAGNAQVALAREDDRYYGCLETQVRSLVPQGSVVIVSTANPGNWATLGKAAAPWAQIVVPGSSGAIAVLSLVQRPSGAACLGSTVEARFADGRVAFGTGASMPGEGPPPATPL